MITFRAATKQLRICALKVADMVAYTLSQYADPCLLEVFKPTLTIIEEAVQAVEVDCPMPLVWYRSAITLWIMDNKQLPPVVHSSSAYEDDILAAQTYTSMYIYTYLHLSQVRRHRVSAPERELTQGRGGCHNERHH